jgi:hypothetical protein
VAAIELIKNWRLFIRDFRFGPARYQYMSDCAAFRGLCYWANLRQSRITGNLGRITVGGVVSRLPTTRPESDRQQRTGSQMSDNHWRWDGFLRAGMEWFTGILHEATARIAPEYFLLPVYGGPSVYRERVYCYELYHQIRLLWPGDCPYRLNGEVDKRAHPYFR